MSDIVHGYRKGRHYAPLDIHASAEELITHAILANDDDNREFVFAIAEEENDVLGDGDQACMPYQVDRLHQIHERFVKVVNSRVMEIMRDHGFDPAIHLNNAHVTKHGTLYVQFV